ncbi:MAG TPA: hypothetical protein VNU97_04020 [Rhizomicrobium sp.]|jgi:hypothetical protein|nr:hypothetical protein [Rhizomicrobium sp.]
MPSSIANFSFKNPPDKDGMPAKGGSRPNDLHIKSDVAGVTLHLHAGGKKGDMLSSTDPKAGFNVAGQDTADIDITNIDVKDGETYQVRVETRDKTGQLPKLTFIWSKNGAAIEWGVNGRKMIEFLVAPDLPKAE